MMFQLYTQFGCECNEQRSGKSSAAETYEDQRSLDLKGGRGLIKFLPYYPTNVNNAQVYVVAAGRTSVASGGRTESHIVSELRSHRALRHNSMRAIPRTTGSLGTAAVSVQATVLINKYLPLLAKPKNRSESTDIEPLAYEITSLQSLMNGAARSTVVGAPATSTVEGACSLRDGLVTRPFCAMGVTKLC